MYIFFAVYIFFSVRIQKDVEAELDRVVGQEGIIHTKMLALQRMGFVQFVVLFTNTHIIPDLKLSHHSLSL